MAVPHDVWYGRGEVAAWKAKWVNKKRGRQPTEWVKLWTVFGRDSTLTNVKR